MLKKIVISALVASCLVSVASASFLEKKDFPKIPQLEKYNMEINAVEDNGGQFLKVYALNDQDEKSIKNLAGYVTRDASVFFFGQDIRFETKDGSKMFKLDQTMITVAKEGTFASYGSGDKEYFVFTDPECPYCQKFEQNLKNLKPGIKINMVFSPLSFHKDAIQMASYVLDGATSEVRAERLEGISHKNRNWAKYTKPLKIEELKKTIIAGMAFGAKGTPAVFTASGNGVDMRTFMQNSFVQAPATSINPQAFNFFKAQDLYVEMNPSSKAQPIVVFADVEDENSKKLLTNKDFLNKHKVSVVLFPKTQQSSGKMLDVYLSSGQDRVKKLNSYLSGKDITMAEMKEIASKMGDKTSKEAEVAGKVAVLGQAMSQLQIKTFPMGILPGGKIINISSFVK